MKNIKVECAVYAAWDYELELKHLNEMSEQGWQLIHGGCFHTKYEKDDSVVYRYQLDHNLRIENRMRYKDTFREQGWEYINSTFNGWHYFRKVYDPEKPAEEYEIYSDRPSKEEMAGRLSKVMLVLALMVAVLLIAGIVFMAAKPEMAYLGIIIEMAAVLALTVTGYVRMRRLGSSEKTGKRFRIEMFIAAAVLGLVWMAIFSSARQEIKMESGSENAYARMDFEMRLPDWINLSVECGETTELNVEITDGNEALLSTRVNAVPDGEKSELGFGKTDIFLMPGRYTVNVWCEPATSFALAID